MSKHEVLTDEEIAKVQAEAFQALIATGYNGGMAGVQWDETNARAIEQAVLAKQTAGVELPQTVTVSQVKNSSYAEGWNDCYGEFMKAIAADRARLAGQDPVGWIDEFGNVYPLAAKRGSSWVNEYQKNWKPIYADPVPEQAEKVEPKQNDENEFWIGVCESLDAGKTSENQIDYADAYADHFGGQSISRVDLVNAVYYGMRYTTAPQILLDAAEKAYAWLEEGSAPSDDLDDATNNKIVAEQNSVINALRAALQEHGRKV